MKHTVTLFVADRRKNKFMEMFDLRPPFKWFVDPVKATFETTTTPLTDQYFQRWIELSKSGVDYWVPAIAYQTNWYADKDVKVISDGTREVFLEYLVQR